jgi:hypothetical protein
MFSQLADEFSLLVVSFSLDRTRILARAFSRSTALSIAHDFAIVPSWLTLNAGVSNLHFKAFSVSAERSNLAFNPNGRSSGYCFPLIN